MAIEKTKEIGKLLQWRGVREWESEGSAGGGDKLAMVFIATLPRDK